MTSSIDLSSELNICEFDMQTSGIGTILLNRPEKLNVLNLATLKAIQQHIDYCLQAESISVIWFEGKGKAFCAGGDVKTLVSENWSLKFFQQFFNAVYQLDHALYHLGNQINRIAIWDGIVMGGGVGLTMSAEFRVATENTMFAMPECLIGLFPDVAASHFFNHIMKISGRCRPDVALYVALTGQRLNAADCIKTNLATHYIPFSKLSSLRESVAGALFEDPSAPVMVIRQRIKTILDGMHVEPTTTNSMASALLDNLHNIERIFGSTNHLDDIYSRLRQDKSAWSKRVLAQLQKQCPISLKITFRHMDQGRFINLSQCFEMEYRLALRCMPSISEHMDFAEGVKALLISKTGKPKWKYTKVEDIPEAIVAAYFDPLPSCMGKPIDLNPQLVFPTLQLSSACHPENVLSQL